MCLQTIGNGGLNVDGQDTSENRFFDWLEAGEPNFRYESSLDMALEGSPCQLMRRIMFACGFRWQDETKVGTSRNVTLPWDAVL